MVAVEDRANRELCVIPLRYSVDKQESSHAQVRLFARKMEDGKFQQIVSVEYKLEEFFCLLDVKNSVYDTVIVNKPICIVIQKVIELNFFISFLFVPVRMSWNIGEKRNLFLKIKSKLGLYHVILTTPKISPEKLTLTVLGRQQLPNIEKTVYTEKYSCSFWTIHNCSRKYA